MTGTIIWLCLGFIVGCLRYNWEVANRPCYATVTTFMFVNGYRIIKRRKKGLIDKLICGAQLFGPMALLALVFWPIIAVEHVFVIISKYLGKMESDVERTDRHYDVEFQRRAFEEYGQ